MSRYQKEKYEEIAALEPLIKIMKACYAFPKDGEHFDWKLVLKFSLIGVVFGSIFLVGAIGHVYISFKRELWPEPIESLSFLIQALMATLIFASFLVNWKNFIINLRRLKLYEFGVPQKCRILSKRIDYTITLVFNGVRVACVLYISLKYFDDTLCIKSGLAEDEGYVCNTPYPLWYPMKMNSLAAELFLLVVSLVVADFYFPMLSVLTAAPLASCGFIIYRLDKLSTLMTKYTIKGGCTRPLKYQEMRFLIGYHSEILSCVQTMNNDLRYNQLWNLLFLPVLMALYLYKFIKQQDAAALLAMFPWFFTSFLLSLFGERLEHERYRLYITFNDIPWYIMNTKTKRTYHIFLGILQRPLHMKVKAIDNMNNIFIYKILKGTYTFLVYLTSSK